MAGSCFTPESISSSKCCSGTGNPAVHRMEHCCSGTDKAAELLVVSWDWIGSTKVETRGASNTLVVFPSRQLLNSEAAWGGRFKGLQKASEKRECSPASLLRR